MTSHGHATRRGRLVDIVGGALLGGIVGAIAAVNFVVFLGPDAGYESSLGDVFADSVVVGVLTVALLLAGPVVGVLIARRARHRSESHEP